MLAFAHTAAVAAAASQLVAGLAAALCSLLPHVALLPLTVPALNSKRWYPQQCPATGRLFRGALQLTSGTLLLLDETGMGAGQLGEAGVKNLQVGSSTLGSCCHGYVTSRFGWTRCLAHPHSACTSTGRQLC